MEVIGTAARDDVKHAAAGPSDFSRESVGIDLKFLYRTLAESRRTKTASACGLTKEQIIRIGTVHQHRIARTSLATKSEIAAPSRIPNDTGSQNGQIEKTSTVDRQIGDGAHIDCGRHIRTRRFDHRDFLGDRYSLRDAADFQFGIHCHDSTNG